METDTGEVKTNVIEGDFGGYGPRQALGHAMKDVEHFRSVVVLAVTEDGDESYLYASEMLPGDLALLAARLSGYSLMIANNWEDSE